AREGRQVHARRRRCGGADAWRALARPARRARRQGTLASRGVAGRRRRAPPAVRGGPQQSPPTTAPTPRGRTRTDRERRASHAGAAKAPATVPSLGERDRAVLGTLVGTMSYSDWCRASGLKSKNSFDRIVKRLQAAEVVEKTMDGRYRAR